MLDSARQLIVDLPEITAPLAALAAAAAVAVVVHGLVFHFLTRVAERHLGLGAALLRQARRPLRLSLILLALILTLPNVPLPYGVENFIRHGLLVLLVVLVGWTLIVLLNYGSERAMSRYRIDTEDNLRPARTSPRCVSCAAQASSSSSS